MRISFSETPKKEKIAGKSGEMTARFELMDSPLNKTPYFVQQQTLELNDSVHSFGKEYKINKKLDQKFAKQKENDSKIRSYFD